MFNCVNYGIIVLQFCKKWGIWVKRVIWIILDSVGCGEQPDAKRFGDEGTNTLAHVWEYNKGLKIPNMINMGLGNIDGMVAVPKTENPTATYFKSKELSDGKDTTVGHWEMVGIETKVAFPTYPNGFPDEIIDEFVKLTGVPGVLGNCTASGTEIIKNLGKEHELTGKPIVYTSADSVFQIACNVDHMPLERLYELCKIARKILVGKHNVSRVIARPFVGTEGNYERTSDRRDYAILPPTNNLLSHICEAKLPSVGVGKIEDIFAGVGISEAIHTKDNMDGVDKTLDYMKTVDEGLIFTNLVEFDSKWGHRNDPAGYGKGLEDFDARLPEIMAALRDEDILIINSDHGCDPTTPGTDHTREHIPVLVYGKKIPSKNLGVRNSFADIGQTIAEYLGVEKISIGESFLEELK